MKIYSYDCIVIGTGAAGYNAACRLKQFGKNVAIELTGENHLQLFIPKGFAHGFSVLSPRAVFQYKCDDYYAPETEGAIAWDDPDLGIDWKIPQKDIILSPKDSSHPRLKDAPWLFI